MTVEYREVCPMQKGRQGNASAIQAVIYKHRGARKGISMLKLYIYDITCLPARRLMLLNPQGIYSEVISRGKDAQNYKKPGPLPRTASVIYFSLDGMSSPPKIISSMSSDAGFEVRIFFSFLQFDLSIHRKRKNCNRNYVNLLLNRSALAWRRIIGR